MVSDKMPKSPEEFAPDDSWSWQCPWHNRKQGTHAPCSTVTQGGRPGLDAHIRAVHHGLWPDAADTFGSGRPV